MPQNPETSKQAKHESLGLVKYKFGTFFEFHTLGYAARPEMQFQHTRRSLLNEPANRGMDFIHAPYRDEPLSYHFAVVPPYRIRYTRR